ncbi:MAG TPA: serine hydrolase domain-containing protein [Gemmatimonadaceae bacterium]|nr:serine hydrolase domain-containing protein [Gemmatimonadaceae bacterium]
MPRIALPLAFLLAASSPAFSQSDARHASIDRIFAAWDSPDSPGCAVGVIQNGELAYARGYGMASLDLDAPMTPRTVFYLASVSKQFTATAAILLAREGRISLDDEVRKHIPELRDYGRPLTVRHLINHTSGLRDYLTLMTLAGMRGEDVHSDEAILELIVRQRELNFPPGTAYLYSNSGYYLLAELVRRVSGQSLREYTDERIFRPLGMTQTHFHDDRLMVVKQRAPAYSPSGDSWRLNVWANFDKVGSGGLMSSIEDLAKWDANFYAAHVGGETLLAELHRQGVLAGGDTIAYAGGLTIGGYRGARTVRHGGSTAGYRNELLRLPDHRFSAIVLCNASSATAGAYAERIADVWLGNALAPLVARSASPAAAGSAADSASGARAVPGNAADRRSLTADALAAYLGDYRSDEVKATWTVAARGDTLVLRHRTLGDRVLHRTGSDRFAAGGMTVEFARSGPNITGMTIRQDRVRALAFVRVR